MANSRDRKKFNTGMKCIIWFLLCAGCCLGQSAWEWKNPLPQGNRLNSITCGAGLYVAVGMGGTVMTSADGLTWEIKKTGLHNTLYSIIYSNNRFVVTGESGAILTSTDGATWQVRSSGVALNLYSVAFGNAMFVATGDSGTIITSADGTAWTKRTSEVTGGIYSVTYGKSGFVALAENNFIQTITLTSPDGITWTRYLSSMNSILDEMTSVACGDSVFLAAMVNGMYTSPNGTTWTKVDSPPQYHVSSVAYLNNQFVAAGAGISFSSDGRKWVTHTTDGFSAITYGNGRYVAPGGSGRMYVSTDGVAWSKTGSGPTNWLYSIAYGDNKFIAVGFDSPRSTVLSSVDAVTWKTEKQDSSPEMQFRSVCYGGGKFVIAGWYKGSANSQCLILTSTDGSTWTRNESIKINAGLHSIIFGNNLFLAVGDKGLMLTSPDAVTWTKRTAPTSKSLGSAVYGDNKYIVVCDSGTMLVSSNGIDWTEKSYSNDYLTSVTFGNGRFAATGGMGANFFTSTDGEAWTKKSVNNTRYQLRCITFGIGTFVAVGNGGDIYVSTDAENWSFVNSGTWNALCSVIFANGQFVTVGEGGTILTAKPGMTAALSNCGFTANALDNVKIIVGKTFVSASLPFTHAHDVLMISIFNVSGKRVHAVETGGHGGVLNVPTPGFPAGMYFLSMTNGNEALTRAFIITK
jgi:photosystem II stability/assembly factor-like uncharacterized protein